MTVLGYREGSEIVHANGLPGSFGDRQRLKFAAGFLGARFRSLACVAFLDVLPNVGAHARSKVQARNLSVGLYEAGVSCNCKVVVVVDNVFPVWDIWEA
jgi:hypothetical protein